MLFLTTIISQIMICIDNFFIKKECNFRQRVLNFIIVSHFIIVPFIISYSISLSSLSLLYCRYENQQMDQLLYDDRFSFLDLPTNHYTFYKAVDCSCISSDRHCELNLYICICMPHILFYYFMHFILLIIQFYFFILIY